MNLKSYRYSLFFFEFNSLLDTVAVQVRTIERDRYRLQYVDMITKCFEQTGRLWEKYDVITGEVVQGCEYETPQVMGRTAGAYLNALAYMKKN